VSHSIPEPLERANPPGLPDQAPPAALTPDSFAERLYLMLAPVARDDYDNAWSLLIYMNAIGTMFQLVEELVRDTPDGPGWSLLLDLNRCPPEALAWLAQLVGVRLPGGLSDADTRAWIASTSGWRRGTRDAMTGAAAATLTGSKTVIFFERDGAAMGYPQSPEYAYCLNVATYIDQTPDPAATLAALIAQKPGGILLNYSTVAGQTYELLNANNADYATVKAKYANYAAVRTDEPN
jgi:hypothetical protein